MALSVYKLRGGPVTPLGYINVPTAGTPVPLSANIDANNSNAPGTVFPPPSGIFPITQTEMTPAFRGFTIQAYKPAANNNGMVATSGNVYLMAAAAGGSGNRTDSGAMIAVIPSGTEYTFPPEATGLTMFSPYYLYLDTDNNNDGGLVTAYGGGQ
jgi:hypothetical protein